MFRTHTCGELRISDVNKQITLSGWVQRSRKMGDRKSTRLNSSHIEESRMPSSA